MAAIGGDYLTLTDLAKSTNAKGDHLAVAEMLSQMDPVLDHAPFVTCNDGLSHRSAIRTGLPTATWTALYEGVQPSRSQKRTVDDATAMLEAESEVDQRLLDLAKNRSQVRLEEAQAFMQTMANEHASKLFYGTNAGGRQFVGLSERFSDLSAENGNQIVDGGGTGTDNASIWMVVWSPMTCFLLTPDGNNIQSGIQRIDRGEQRTTDASGNPYYVEAETFRLHTGVSVKDWRYVVRIANLDRSNIASGSSAPDLLALLRKGYYRLQSRRMPMGKVCIYMDRDVLEYYDELVTDKSNVQLTIQQAGGNVAAASSYRDIPIYECDALNVNEAQVT